MRNSSSLALLALGLALPATAQTTRVIPASAAKADGNSSTPFLTGYGAGRSQQIWSASAVTRSIAVIRGISYRLDGRNRQALAKRDLQKCTIDIGVTKVAPTGMVADWTKNLSSKLTNVFSGTFSAPAQSGTGPIPRPFNITYPMKSAFTYNARSGNLVTDWTIAIQPTKSNYFLDAVTQTAGSKPGSITNIGQSGSFGDKSQPKLAGQVVNLKPGGSVDLAVGNLNKQYFGQLIFGVTDSAPGLPYDLANINAPGNKLYVSIDAAFLFPAKQAGSSWSHSFSRSIPNDQGLLGLNLFAQSWFGDASANPLGVVVSNALKLSMPTVTSVDTNTVNHYSFSSATGFVNRTPMGHVVQFTGVLP